MKYIAVFAGASENEKIPQKHIQAAKNLGKLISQNGFGLVYGGVNQGLMGEIAKAVFDNNGQVIGIHTPGERSVLLDDITLREVADYEERNRNIFEQASAVIILPGGIGTQKSLLDVISYNGSIEDALPICILNIEGFYDGSIMQLRKNQENGYAKEHNEIFVSGSPQEIIGHLMSEKQFTLDEQPRSAYMPYHATTKQQQATESKKRPTRKLSLSGVQMRTGEDSHKPLSPSSTFKRVGVV